MWKSSQSQIVWDLKNKNFSFIADKPLPWKVSGFLSLQLLHIKHKGITFQVSRLLHLLKCPFQDDSVTPDLTYTCNTYLSVVKNFPMQLSKLKKPFLVEFLLFICFSMEKNNHLLTLRPWNNFELKTMTFRDYVLVVQISYM